MLRDAISNLIEVTRHADNCLFYDRPLTIAGLTWGELVDWWREIAQLTRKDDIEVARSLYTRLGDSVRHNPVEHLVFRTYCERYASPAAHEFPALLPQVYLHFDPLTRKQRGGRHSVLARERMDFLLLLPNAVRIVLEVDGKQHYANGEEASPRLYSEMAAEDRRLRLRGYEVYRFGGFELSQPQAAATLRTFFDDLFEKHLTANWARHGDTLPGHPTQLQSAHFAVALKAETRTAGACCPSVTRARRMVCPVPAGNARARCHSPSGRLGRAPSRAEPGPRRPVGGSAAPAVARRHHAAYGPCSG